MFKATHPILGTRDILRAIEFYTQQLGFALAFGDKPNIHRTMSGSAATRSSSTCSFSSSTRWARSACASWLRIRMRSSTSSAHAASNAHPAVRDTPWGTREFALYDLDRNALTFYRHLTSAEKARQSS